MGTGGVNKAQILQSAEYYQNWMKKFFFRKTPNFCICFKGFVINTDPMSLKV